MIALINPFITSVERYGKEIGDIGGHQMPLGIYYLAAVLLRDGEEPEVMDAEAMKLVHEDLVKKLRQAPPALIGITSTTVAFRNARSLAELLRRELPGVPIVIGGPHMTALPEPTMRTGAFDYGIVREGEEAFSELVRLLLHGHGSAADIANLWQATNAVVTPPSRVAYISDIDTIPFPARQLCGDIAMYRPPVGAFRREPVMSLITSRGCPYQCTFCDNNTFGRKTRFFSAEYVVREIEEVFVRYGAREIAFLDDTFVLDKKRLHRIFELLEKKNIEVPWTCMTRANNLDFETLKFMADKGCWQLRVGVESGNQNVLDFIKKGITLEQVRNVAAWCEELKIQTTGFFMIGHHIDTPETIQQTIEFALSLPFTDVTATINTPMPGTESYETARLYGTYDESDWTSLNYWTPVFVPKGLTRELMLEKQSELYRRFYMRPGVLLRQLRKIRSPRAAMLAAKNAILALGFIQKRHGPQRSPE